MKNDPINVRADGTLPISSKPIEKDHDREHQKEKSNTKDKSNSKAVDRS